MGIKIDTIRKMVQRGPPRPSSATTPAPSVSVDNFTIGAMRRHLHLKFAAKDFFTVKTLTEDLIQANIMPTGTSITTVWRTLHQKGFRYKVSQSKMYARKESLDILCHRVRALRALQQLRKEGRQVVNVDETWFTTHMNDYTETRLAHHSSPSSSLTKS